MTIKDDFDIIKLFMNKNITVSVGVQSFIVHVPTVTEFMTDKEINSCFTLWTMSKQKLKSTTNFDYENSFSFVQDIVFNLGKYIEFEEIANSFTKALKFYIPEIEFDYAKKILVVNGIQINETIWNYILYLINLSCGMKVEKPRTFKSEAEKKFYLAQKEMEDKIQSIKEKNKTSENDGLMKAILLIIYSFPSLTIDYLIQQTMAQIHWLHSYAAESVSYARNAQAWAAGNLKSGAKVDFFIK